MKPMPRQITIRSDKAYEIASRRARETGRTMESVVEEALETLDRSARAPRDVGAPATPTGTSSESFAADRLRDLGRLVEAARAKHGDAIDIADPDVLASALALLPAERRAAAIDVAIRAAALRVARDVDVTSHDADLWTADGLPR